MGLLLMEERDLQQAAERCEKARTLFAALGDRLYEALFLANMSLIMQEEGRLDEAARYMDRSVRTLEELGERRWEGGGHTILATILFELGQTERARAEARIATRIESEVGDRVRAMEALSVLGGFEAAAGNLATADGIFKRVDELLSELNDPTYDVFASLMRGLLDVARSREALLAHDEQEAAQQRARAEARLGAIDAPLSEHPLLIRGAHRILARALGV